jgi:hypothetical protein
MIAHGDVQPAMRLLMDGEVPGNILRMGSAKSRKHTSWAGAGWMGRGTCCQDWRRAPWKSRSRCSHLLMSMLQFMAGGTWKDTWTE